MGAIGFGLNIISILFLHGDFFLWLLRFSSTWLSLVQIMIMAMIIVMITMAWNTKLPPLRILIR